MKLNLANMSVSILSREVRNSIFCVVGVYILPTAVLVAALWLPFGFSLTGLIEEWDLLGWFTTSGLFFNVHADGPIPQHLLRPLLPLTFGVAYLIDSDSFFGFHLMMIGALLVKGAAMTFLVGRATKSQKYGVMAAVFLLLYPADTMQLSFRSLHINWSNALSLLGSAFFYNSIDLANRLRRYFCAFIGFLLFFSAILMYEVAATAVILPSGVSIHRKGIESCCRSAL